MTDKDLLTTIREKVAAGSLITPAEATVLLKALETLEKKTALLSQHVLELSEEIENVKSDFGGGSR